ncbi:unnamed protein product [Cochlearia groenlandica]
MIHNRYATHHRKQKRTIDLVFTKNRSVKLTPELSQPPPVEETEQCRRQSGRRNKGLFLRRAKSRPPVLLKPQKPETQCHLSSKSLNPTKPQITKE